MMRHEIDIRLFFLFEALLRHRNVTLAAKAASMSQSAASKALNKLRRHYGDALFVRTRAGMVPTDRAQALAPIVRECVLAARRALNASSNFDPRSDERTIAMSLMDLTELIVAENLIPKLVAQAPNCRFETRDLWGEGLARALEDQHVDLVIGGPLQFRGGVRQQKLFEHRFVVAAHSKLAFEGKIGLPEFAASRFIAMQAAPGAVNAISGALSASGYAGKPFWETPHGLIAGYLVSNLPESVTIVPQAIAEIFARRFGLKVLFPTFDLPRIEVFQYWHERTNSDPFGVWLRGMVREALFHAPTLHMEGLSSSI